MFLFFSPFSSQPGSHYQRFNRDAQECSPPPSDHLHHHGNIYPGNADTDRVIQDCADGCSSVSALNLNSQHDFTKPFFTREVPGYDFPCQNPYGRYGFFPSMLYTLKYDFWARRIRVDWLSHEPCFVWRFCVIRCRKIFRVQIWYEKHRFSAGSFDFSTNFQNKKA